MTLNAPTPSWNYVPEYQLPGIPWVTSSFVSDIVRHDFQHVASSFALRNNSTGSIKLAFTQNGFSSGNCLILLPTESISVGARIKSLYISGSARQEYSLIASLTLVPAYSMPNLTGSNTPYSGSVYWDGIG